MKLSAFLVAASIAAGALGSAAVQAQPVTRSVTTTTTTRVGPGYRHGWRGHHQHCRTEWHHHRRVTRCW